MTNLAHKIDPASIRYTVEEYLTGEREAEVKSEYYDGQIVMMAGGSETHNVITSNLHGELFSALRGTPCRPFTSDLKVQSFGRHFYYPDVTVVWGDREFFDDARDVLTNPALIAEVLSPATEPNDRGVKWAHYQRMPSLRHYLLIWQMEPRVEHFHREDDGEWRYESVSGWDSALRLRSLNITLSLAGLYDGVDLPPFTTEE